MSSSLPSLLAASLPWCLLIIGQRNHRVTSFATCSRTSRNRFVQQNPFFTSSKPKCLHVSVSDDEAPTMTEQENDDDIEIAAFWEEDDPPQHPFDHENEFDDEATTEPKKLTAWDLKDPREKLRIIKAQHAKAIANKKKREPHLVKKRRMMMYYKEAQRTSKLQSRIPRPTPFSNRTPLSQFSPGQVINNGTVISLTPFGCYVDVGTECDGLLHISQMWNPDEGENLFVEDVREVVSPGDVLHGLRVRRVSPELKKMQLTMLPLEQSLDLEDEQDEEEEESERIPLTDIAVDDELWGVITRVTNYGAYVELGAVVPGFLHFMDHPDFGLVGGAHPSTYMKVGQRVRVWASKVDLELERVQLTAKRPLSLPRLRRQMRLR